MTVPPGAVSGTAMSAEPGGQGSGAPDATAVFAAHRPLLFTVAYEMLGMAADAEDIVQEVWLRWADAAAGRAGVPELDPTSTTDPTPTTDPIRNPRAYLVRIATRLALNRLRTLSRRREDYVGPWLPEPVVTTPDLLDDVVLAESVSLAMLVVLESLSPRERAVFVLREVFGFDFDDIGAAVDRSPAAARQIAHRAREHVQARRPRFDADAVTVRAVMDGFLAALGGGDLQGLMDLLAPDVVLLSDGGGKRQAARRPLHGADDVARFLIGILRKAGEFRVEEQAVNGAPGWLVHAGATLDSVVQLVVHGGRIQQVLFIRNPDKLVGAAAQRTLRF